MIGRVIPRRDVPHVGNLKCVGQRLLEPAIPVGCGNKAGSWLTELMYRPNREHLTVQGRVALWPTFLLVHQPIEWLRSVPEDGTSALHALVLEGIEPLCVYCMEPSTRSDPRI